MLEWHKMYHMAVTLLFFWQISFGPIGWLMISEIFPLRVRGRGLSLAVLINFAANALVTFAFSPLQVNILLIVPFYNVLKLITITLVWIWEVFLCSFWLNTILWAGLIGSWGVILHIWSDSPCVVGLHILCGTRDKGPHFGGDWGQTPLGFHFLLLSMTPTPF